MFCTLLKQIIQQSDIIVVRFIYMIIDLWPYLISMLTAGTLFFYSFVTLPCSLTDTDSDKQLWKVRFLYFSPLN